MGGAQIVFRGNSGFVPAGRMSATCRSPDGVSVDGTWTPDPADLVCNGETMQSYMKYLISASCHATYLRIQTVVVVTYIKYICVLQVMFS